MSELFLRVGAESVVRCEACGAPAARNASLEACAACGGLLEVIHPDPGAEGSELIGRFSTRGTLAGSPADSSGVWRFAALVMPGTNERVSYPEGNTPLLSARGGMSHADLAGYTGIGRLFLKHEGMNPTGSFKDRGMTVAVTDAVRRGKQLVVCASTGNTSASLAAYAARAGLQAFVFVPRGKVAAGKMAQTTAHHARIVEVNGDFDASLMLARAAARRFDGYLANSVNPWRIEGQKTIVWELLSQLDWLAPDWIVLPAGALGNTAAFGKALREAKSLGLIKRVPRLLAVQADGAAPFARGFAEGFTARREVTADTVASAIRIGNPASWTRAVRAIRETNGVVAAVSDDAILETKAVIDASGIGCEPASAASVAGARALRAGGVIGAGETVVCVLTGHILKDPESVEEYHATTLSEWGNRPIRMEADESELDKLEGG